jgi:hypothetical protein
MQIREARSDDAPAACEVLRRSIVELCRADHGDDPAFLEEWLANKTPANISDWIAQNHVYVAVRDQAIIGIGAVTADGVITLNYVSPDARFQGASKAMLARLEQKAAECGNTVCKLSSTKTARRFYRAAGYEEQAESGGACIAMTKLLPAAGGDKS